MLIVFISLPFTRPKVALRLQILIFFVINFQVYTAQRVEYSGGVFFGNENDEQNKKLNEKKRLRNIRAVISKK